MRYFQTEAEAAAFSSDHWPLTRRGFDLGWAAPSTESRVMPSSAAIRSAWDRAEAIRLPGLLFEHLPQHADAIRDALTIMRRVRDGESCADILSDEPYHGRLQPDFDLLAPVYNETDEQEIEKVVFDAVKSGEVHAEDLWMKCSCLSFHEPDESIRFRFSYGMEMYKSHEGDLLRERLAAELAARVFPECAIVTEHPELNDLLDESLGYRPEYVEKIIFSNAPEGGAQFHQDVEKGHSGVLYAQLYGHTGWLALPRAALLEAAAAFIADPANAQVMARVFPQAADRQRLEALAADPAQMAALVEADDQQVLERFLNTVPEFTRLLIDAGWGTVLSPGDVILLPQASTEHCCWHSVFCLDDKPGHSLSFAFIDPAVAR
ncbi:MAG TPA: hypothetical protein VNI58_00615 [Mariprofundaceae bacterium]|nr:hypothetical protein [Mariprofundaceae bacterium]